MKKQHALLIILCNLCVIYSVNALDNKEEKQQVSITKKTLIVPENFYTLDDDQVMQDALKGQIVFYVIVPEFSDLVSKSELKQNMLKQFVNAVMVPKDFFSEGMPAQAIKPVSLYFDWQEEENAKTRKQAAGSFAVGINALKKRYKKSRFIVVGMGQGGNLIHNATQKIISPLDVVIELAVPVFPQDSVLSADYTLNNAMVNRLFSFYTGQDFQLAHPTLHPEYLHYNSSSVHPLLSNILLLINNKHPIPGQMMQSMVGKRLLGLCKKIQDTYAHYNHLVAHISTIKPAVDLVVVLRNFSMYPKKIIDQKKLSQEQMLSTVYTDRFKKLWGRPLAVNIKNSEQQPLGIKGLHKVFSAKAS
ncbi:hypothetical protein EBU24_03280 [bacterium]|nr:hypothetical protein [bacterium]